MKKFISLLMAAAMVVTMVPATAFAANANIKLVGGTKTIATDKVDYEDEKANEIRIKIDEDSTLKYGEIATFTFTVTNAVFDDTLEEGDTATADAAFFGAHKIGEDDAYTVVDFLAGALVSSVNDSTPTLESITCVDLDDDTQTIEVKVGGLNVGDQIAFVPQVDLTKETKNTKVTLDVSADKNISEDFSATIITISDTDFKVTASVAEQSEEKALDSEVVGLKKIVIDDTIGGTLIAENNVIKITLKGDYEWANGAAVAAETVNGISDAKVVTDEDGDRKIMYIKVDADTDKITIYADTLEVVAIEDVSAGDSVKATFELSDWDMTGKVDFDTEETSYKLSNVTVLDVVEEEGVTVALNDEDEDMVVAWAGTTDDSDAWKALSVLIDGLDSEEFNEKRKMTVSFPEGVFVTDVDFDNSVFEVTDYDMEANEITMAVTDPDDFDDEEVVTFHFVTEATFSGEVEATFGGTALPEEYSVVVAEAKPVATIEAGTVKVESGYKSVEIPGTVTFTEGAEDLFSKNNRFTFSIPQGKTNSTTKIESIPVEFTADVNAESDAEIEVLSDDCTVNVNSVSDSEAMVVTLSDMVVYIPTTTALGSYKLRAYSTYDAKHTAYGIFDAVTVEYDDTFADFDGLTVGEVVDKDHEDVGFNSYVESADNFIEVVAAGMVSQTQTSSFTSVVDVTIGANQIVVDGTPVAIDAPAYINKDNRTMVPLRAVAVALGVSDDQIVWVAAEKTVIVNYADTWISMVIGSQIMKVNGIEMAMTTAPEISNSRTFLPMADLGRALGVTATWDAATKTASFNK